MRRSSIAAGFIGALALIALGMPADVQAQRGGGPPAGQGRPAGPGQGKPAGTPQAGQPGGGHGQPGGSNAGGHGNANGGQPGGGRGANAGGGGNANGGGRPDGAGNPGARGGGNGRGRSNQPTPDGETAGRGGRGANPNGNTRDTEGFRNYGQLVAARHVSENLGIDFDKLKTLMTGDNAKSLGQAIQELRPDVDANAEAAKAEKQAETDTKD